MGATPPYGPFQAIAQRVTKVTDVGHPIPGAKNGYFTKQLVSFKVGLDVQAATRDTLERGDGRPCQTSTSDAIILGAKLDIDYCVLDAALIGFMTGSTVYVDTNIPIGYQVLGPSDSPPNGVIWEGWSKAWDSDKQAAASVVGSVATYFHWVLPLLKCQLGDQTNDTKHNAVPVTGAGSSNDFATINGPYDDWPDAIAEAGGVTRPYAVFLDTLPATAEGYLTVTAAAS